MNPPTINDEVNRWLDTWAPHCGSPRNIFVGQFKTLLAKIFDEIDKRADNNIALKYTAGVHYQALRDVRNEIGAPEKPIRIE